MCKNNKFPITEDDFDQLLKQENTKEKYATIYMVDEVKDKTTKEMMKEWLQIVIYGVLASVVLLYIIPSIFNYVVFGKKVSGTEENK